MSQILVELVKLANLIINITKSLACAKRIESILETETSLAEGASVKSDDNAPAVVFSHVSFKYDGAGEASLTDIDFTAERGETIGIIGGTAAEKPPL